MKSSARYAKPAVMFSFALLLCGLLFIEHRGASAQAGQRAFAPIKPNQIVSGELTASNSHSPQQAQPNPTPAIANINPNAVVAGGAAFTLTINGTNFVSGSVVRVNGADRMTTVASATQLRAAISAADIAAAGAARITVFNPTPGGGSSNEVLLAINSPVASVSAASFLASLGLAPDSIVSAFGTKLATATQGASTQPLPTTIAGTTLKIRDNAGAEQLASLFFVAPNQINYQLPANIANGPATVTVTSGDGSVSTGMVQVAAVAPGLFAANANGQGAAAGLALRVRNPNPVPTITSLSPSSAVAGSPGFTLTVNGASFISGTVLRWNGADRATTVVSATQLRAAIPAADIASTGAAAITVFNPELGGGASNALNFSINNPTPSISSMSHASTTSGGPGFTLTITGSNFIPASVARWNGAERATTVVSNSRLMAEITAADIAAAVDGSVTVFNPPPGGGTSGSQRIFVFDGNQDVRLTSGVAVTGNFSASPPGACGLRVFPQYTIQVPDGASQLRIALTSSQDLDLFARFAQRVDTPSSIVADYSSRSSGGNETITVAPSSSPPLQAGKYFVLIANCSTSAATFSLTATVTGGAAADPPVIASDAQPDTPKPAEESGEAKHEDPVFVYFPKPAKSEQDVIESLAPLWVQRGSLLLLPGNVGTKSTSASDSHDYGSGTGWPTMNSSLPAIPSQGTQSFEPLVRFDQAQNRFVAAPIDLGPASDDVFLVLYGTGIRLRSSLGMVTARVGGVTVPVLFAGATPGLIGLDQINLGPLPRSLTGRGEVDVVLMADGKVANTVRVSFK